MLSSRFLFVLLMGTGMGLSFGACSTFTLRPVQLMSDTAAALKAAREVKADTLAPELFRQSSEWYLKSKREYQLKNYGDCEKFARKAKYFAEQAEFEAIKNGATRTEFSAPDPLADTAMGPSKSTVGAGQSSGPVYSPEQGVPPISIQPGVMQQSGMGAGGAGAFPGSAAPSAGFNDPTAGAGTGGAMTDPSLDPSLNPSLDPSLQTDPNSGLPPQ